MCASYDSAQRESSQVAPQKTPLDELQDRARRLQALMRDEGLAGVFATQNADVFYLSGVVQQAQVYLPVEGEPVLMVRKHPGRALMASALDERQVAAVRWHKVLPALIA